MTTEPDGTNSEPAPIQKFRGQGWYNIWGVLLAVFVGLVCACAYWIVQLGFYGAVENSVFGYEAVFAALLGIVLIARWSIPRLLMDAPSLDPRTGALTRSWWWARRWGGKP
jgi:hypothetical protein